jgi:hypothetical protein
MHNFPDQHQRAAEEASNEITPGHHIYCIRAPDTYRVILESLSPGAYMAFHLKASRVDQGQRSGVFTVPLNVLRELEVEYDLKNGMERDCMDIQSIKRRFRTKDFLENLHHIYVVISLALMLYAFTSYLNKIL